MGSKAERQPGASGPAPGGTELARLRLLLSVPDPAEWSSVRGYVADPDRRARDLSEALPDAVRLGHSGGKLRSALGPAVEESLRLSVQRNPEVITTALFPIIGAMIRRYIADALADLQDSIAQTVESSFSARSVSWRFQAWRQGRPFASILLEKSLCFRVEQVFLIDRRTGLLLLHRRAPEVDVKDPTVISGMLTAIQDFVQDSFGGKETALDAVRLGEHTLWINSGPKAVLTCVIRGVPPVPLRQTTEQTVEDIHRDFAEPLEDFDGDAAPFEAAAGHLDRCLLGGAGSKRGRSPKKLIAAIAMAALVLVGWAGYRWYQQYRFDQFVAQLRAQPGLAIIEARREGSGWMVRGMRDPLAADGLEIAQSAGFGDVRFQWEPFHSLAAPFGPRRIAEERARFIERTVLRWDQFAVRAPAGEIETLAADLKAIEAATGGRFQLRILGAAAEGNGLDERLSRERAAAIETSLKAQGVAGEAIRTEFGPLPGDRTIRFRVSLPNS